MNEASQTCSVIVVVIKTDTQDTQSASLKYIGLSIYFSGLPQPWVTQLPL